MASGSQRAQTSGPDRWIPMKALGRRFQIGTLYNYHQDCIVPETYLWDPDDIKSKIERNAVRKFKTYIHVADNHQEKMASLGIDAHLQISLMGNLIDDYRGASAYIDDHHEQNQVGVCFHCRATDRYEQVEPRDMKGFDFLCTNQLLRQGAATHVVVAITYGAECFCVARQPIREDEDEQEVQERLKEWFEHWRGCLEDEKEMHESHLDQVHCRFYTDSPMANPVTSDQDCYKNCLQVSQLGKGQAVPLVVWLCPLRDITAMAPRKQPGGEISQEGVARSCQLMNQFKNIEQRLDELVSATKNSPALPLGPRVTSFSQCVRKYRHLVDKRLREVIGRVRCGAEGEAALDDVIAVIRQSAFDPERLCTWVTLKKNEMADLQRITSMPHIRLIFDREPLATSAHSCSLVLCLPQLHRENVEEVEQMRLYVERNTQLVRWTAPLAAGRKTCPAGSNAFRSELVRLSALAAENVEAHQVGYFVLYDGRNQSSSATFQLYQGSKLISDHVQLPEAPVDLRVVENRRATVRLQWDVVNVPLLEHFLIEYREQAQSKWNQVTGSSSCTFQFQTLRPKTAYCFRVAAVYAFSRSAFSSETAPETVQAVCDAPQSISLRYATESSLSIQWADPVLEPDISIQSYSINYWPENNPADFRQTTTTEKICKIEQLDRSTRYKIQLIADCGPMGTGAASEPITMATNDQPESAAVIVRDYIHDSHQNNIDDQDGLEILHLPLKETMLGKETLIRHCQFGEGPNYMVRKTILVVGATGAGKTTLINGMINYILGVKWEDDFRFKLIKEPPKTQAVSQTDHVTAYDIFRMRGSNLDTYSLTIVDTPGFGDTRGLERDKMIMEQVRQYFQSPDGIQELEAVCFLIQASLARLTPTQKYIYDSILSIFGKDIKDNIRLMITFADNAAPPVLEAVLESDIPYPLDSKGKPLHHKFNNSCILSAKSAEPNDDVFPRMFYDMGTRNFKQFFTELGRMKTTSLTLTKEVLVERKKLEVVVEGLQQRIQHGLNQIEEFRQIKKALTENEQQMDANRNFDFQVEISVQDAVDISGTGHYVTNCDHCKWTCHYPCKHANDADRRNCFAMDDRGNCRVCPGKCLWSKHFNQKIRYEWVKKKVDRSSEAIRQKYQDAQKKTLGNKQLIEQLAKDLESHEKDIMELVNITYPSIQRLNEIALKPHPFSAPEYIDLIIEAEQREHRDGYLHRIETLQQLRKMAEIQQKMINKEKVFDATAATAATT